MKLSDLKAGDVVRFVGSSSCIETGSMMFVHATNEGELYVGCRCGCHFLDTDEDEIVGFEKVASELQKVR